MGWSDGRDLLSVDPDRPLARQNLDDGRMDDQPAVPFVNFQTALRGGTAQLVDVSVLEIPFLFFIVEWPGPNRVVHHLPQNLQLRIEPALSFSDCGDVPFPGGLLQLPGQLHQVRGRLERGVRGLLRIAKGLLEAFHRLLRWVAPSPRYGLGDGAHIHILTTRHMV